MDRIRVRPRKLTDEECDRMGLENGTSLRVLDPASGRPIPAEADTIVVQIPYWTRRLADGDVTLAKDAPRSRGKREE